MNQYRLLFKNRNFSKFITAISFIYLAQSIVDIAIIWLVYEKTQQPLFIALSIFITQVPALISAPFLGVLMDKINVSQTIALASFTKTLVFIILCMLSVHRNNVILIIIALLLILNSTVAPLISTGSVAIIQEILAEHRFHSANALVNISFDVCYLLGAFIIIDTINHQLVFLFSACLFAIATILMLLIVPQALDSQNIREEKSTIANQKILRTFQYLTTNKKLAFLILLTSLWNLLIWGAFPIVFPVFVQKNLHATAATYGLINGIQSFGIILGSLIIGALPKRKESFNLSLIFLIVHCVFIAFFSLQHQLIPAVSLLILAGIVSSPVMIYKSTFFQEEIPSQLKGRLFSIIGLLGTITYPIGNFLTASILSYISSTNASLLLFAYATILLVFSLLLFIYLQRSR